VHQRGLCRAVGPMEHEQLVHCPRPHEVAQQPIERVLDLLLPRHPAHPLTVGEVVELEPAHGAGRMLLHRRGPEVVEHVSQILRGVADLGVCALEEQLEVFLEGEDASVLEEVAAHHRSHLLEEILRAHGRLLLAPAGSVRPTSAPLSLAPLPTGAPLASRTAAWLANVRRPHACRSRPSSASTSGRPTAAPPSSPRMARSSSFPTRVATTRSPPCSPSTRKATSSSATRRSASGSSIRRTRSTAASGSSVAAGRARSSRRCASRW